MDQEVSAEGRFGSVSVSRFFPQDLVTLDRRDSPYGSFILFLSGTESGPSKDKLGPEIFVLEGLLVWKGTQGQST